MWTEAITLGLKGRWSLATNSASRRWGPGVSEMSCCVPYAMEMTEPLSRRWMWPSLLPMGVAVLVGTMVPPLSWRTTWRVDPVTTWPAVGDRIWTVAVVDGRCACGFALPLLHAVPTTTSATARVRKATSLRTGADHRKGSG